MEIKLCKRCSQIKDIGLFYKNKLTKDGLSIYCKSCQEEASVKYRASDKGKECAKKYKASDNYNKKKELQKQYQKSDQYKIVKKKYLQSDKGKIVKKKHQKSDKGKDWKKKYLQSDKGKVASGKLKEGFAYISRLLKTQNIPIYPEIIELKRLHLKLKRTINNKQHGKENASE